MLPNPVSYGRIRVMKKKKKKNNTFRVFSSENAFENEINKTKHRYYYRESIQKRYAYYNILSG